MGDRSENKNPELCSTRPYSNTAVSVDLGDFPCFCLCRDAKLLIGQFMKPSTLCFLLCTAAHPEELFWPSFFWDKQNKMVLSLQNDLTSAISYVIIFRLSPVPNAQKFKLLLSNTMSREIGDTSQWCNSHMGVHSLFPFSSWFSLSPSIYYTEISRVLRAHINKMLTATSSKVIKVATQKFYTKSRIFLTLFWLQFCSVLTHESEGTDIKVI